MAYDKHVPQLMKGADAWNAWRNENPNSLVHLSEWDFTGANLSGANLSGAKLRSACKSEIKMRNCCRWRGNRSRETTMAGLNNGGGFFAVCDRARETLNKTRLRRWMYQQSIN